MPDADEDHGPGVAVPPPAIIGVLLLFAWLLGLVVPVPLGAPLRTPGLAVMALGVALAGWALALMLRARTDPRPDRPDTALIEAGPFRFGRNPVYLGGLVFAAGLALRWASLWGWLAVAAAFAALDRAVVPREERYLRRRFGAAYEAYAARVRRWV
jgi:protein-S-isoprenylcysteine O-methyltransferase Ste14